MKDRPTINHYARKLGGAHLDTPGKKTARRNRERVRLEQKAEQAAHEKKWKGVGKLMRQTKNNNTMQPLPSVSQDKERLRTEAAQAYEEWKSRADGQ